VPESSSGSDRLREILDQGDAVGLRALLADRPQAALTGLPPSRAHRHGAAPLSYVAMLRLDTSTGTWRDVPGTAALAQALLDAGAPVDGNPGESETPLMTAASYGDAAVARVLVAAGADLEAHAAPHAGGVPGGTALLHAAVFGMTDVLDVLAAAGAHVPDGVQAAAVGTLTGWDLTRLDAEDLLRAFIFATHHERLDAMRRLVDAGAPFDAVDAVWGRHPLRLAAASGRALSVRLLLDLGADPSSRDAEGRTALDHCREGRRARPGASGYDEIEAMLTRASGSG
jgi:ankyrin repeat protein